jgi:16S rRNA (adenine1518-N6/adenine1519-N6)-dimethyltransferase
MISPAQIKDICRRYGITPNHSLGQHFLLDTKVIDEMVAVAQVASDDTILEIGPGLGVLTETLLEEAGSVVAIDQDPKMIEMLQGKFLPNSKLRLISGDALKLRPEQEFSGPYKIVANIPYTITSALLEKFLTAPNPPVSMTLLVQREVAQRVCAAPGKMSVLSVSVQLYGAPRLVRMVERRAFWPQPKVTSAVLHIGDIGGAAQLEKRLNGITEKVFWQTVKIGYAARRKQLHNTLAAGFHLSPEQIQAELVRIKVAPTVRAQELSVDQWLALAKNLKIYSS